MKRKIFMIIAIITIVLILTICLVSCEKETDTCSVFNIGETNLICIGTTNSFNSGYALYYDKDTKVMYMFVKHGYGAGLTPLYNADGTLKLYTEEK